MQGYSLLIIVIVALRFIFNTADATTWYVHPDSALNSIQAALDSCADNDIVLVGPGIYIENIVWPNTQGIHLISESGSNATIIDGNSNGSVITCTTGVDTTAIIRGFTIQHGFRPYGGGGILCWDSSPIIEGNIITDNRGWDGGGGILCWDSSPIIEGNIIADNHAWDEGGGISSSGGSPIIINNIINANTAISPGGGADGGGIRTEWLPDDTVRIIGNTIANNYALGSRPGMGGISCYIAIVKNNTISNNWFGGIGCHCATIDSCTISNNYGCGVSCGAVDSPNITISYCNIFGNADYGVSNICPDMPINAEYNWWGDATGPYHPTLNPGGLGDSVSDYVDFEPWLSWPVGVEEQLIVSPVETHESLTPTIFRGPLQLPKDKKCKVLDITGRIVEQGKILPGIYFIEVDGVVTQKVIKIR